MKTQVIQLDPHDDIVSVRDRLGWARARRVVLIWPERGRILQRRLDLVLLKRFAQRSGVQIGLVTEDTLVLNNARENNIPVFENAVQAQQGRWRSGRRQRAAQKKLRPNRTGSSIARGEHPTQRDAPDKRSSSQLLRAGLFTASILAVLAVLFSLLPGATIAIRQPQSEQTITLQLQAADQATTGQFSLQVTTIIVEARSRQAATGSVIVPEKTASGSVQFTNLTEGAVTIPVGTIVTTLSEPVVRFITTESGKVPAGIGRSLLVEIKAIDPGAQGNLPAGSLQAIEGNLGLSLTARNIYATRGGSSRKAAGPNQADREALLDRTLAELQIQARKEILSRWHTNPLSSDYPITETLRLDEILEQTFNPAEDWPSSELNLILRVSFSADAIPGDQLVRYFETAMDNQMKPGQKPLDGEMKFVVTKPPTKISNTVQGTGNIWTLEMEASRPIQQTFVSEEISDLSRMLPASQASDILANLLELEEPPVVTIWPVWWPYLPVTNMRIQVSLLP